MPRITLPSIIISRRMRLFLAALFVWFVSVLPASAAPVSPNAVTEALASYVRAHPYALVAVGVIDRGREKTYFVRGSQAKGQFDEHTQFQIGSITKLFTATLLAQFVDSGRMKLSDPIQMYLPAGVIAPAYHGQPITLLDVATHMSGLPTDPPNLAAVRDVDTYSLKMLDDALSSTKLTRAPGAHWEYSNFAFAVLGQILAGQAHLSYDDLVKQRILDPLRMRDTVVSGSAATRATMAPAFEYGGAPAQPQSFGVFAPAGSIESDLSDMMVFLKANLDAPGGPLGPAFALAQQQRTRVPEWSMAMGLAWQTVLPRAYHIAGDLGDLPAGWLEKGGNTDGYATFIGLDHTGECGFVAMTNVNDDDFQQVIAHAISPSTAHMPVLWATAKRQPSPLSGNYTITTGRRMTLNVFKYNGDLYVWIPSATTPSKLRLIHPNQYSWDDLHVVLTFHIDASGRATGLTAVQSGKTMQAKKNR